MAWEGWCGEERNGRVKAKKKAAEHKRNGSNRASGESRWAGLGWVGKKETGYVSQSGTIKSILASGAGGGTGISVDKGKISLAFFAGC